MTSDEFKHRCTTEDCPFKGQITSKSCGCHVTERDMMLARILAQKARIELLEEAAWNCDHGR